MPPQHGEWPQRDREMAKLVETIPATSDTGRVGRSEPMALGRFRTWLRRMFYGHRPAAVAFQAGLLAIDFAAIAYFLATTFVADAPWLRTVDLLLGILLALEFLGRMFAHRHL